ncbi:MAG: hypothetical protein HWD60_08480 [Defluviicoccus sp.]|nr:MAG: hypothetical protein HWD60_08480 [Defluviicoccus sp.]
MAMSFNDIGIGGNGTDTIVGDILQQLTRDTLALTVEAGTGGEAWGQVIFIRLTEAMAVPTPRSAVSQTRCTEVAPMT